MLKVIEKYCREKSGRIQEKIFKIFALKLYNMVVKCKNNLRNIKKVLKAK